MLRKYEVLNKIIFNNTYLNIILNYARIFKRTIENTRLLYITWCYTKTN